MKEYDWYSCDNQVNNYNGREPELLYHYQRAEDLNIMHLICLGSYSFTPNYEFFRHGVFPFSEPFYPCVIGEEWRSRTWQNHMVIMNHSAPLSQWGNGFYDGESPYQYSYPPAMDFCDETHELGGVVLGTHPFWFDPFTEMEAEGTNRNLAFELPADIALGKMDGMQIYMYWGFDQWNRYVWYRLMNCGFKIAPFAGTDALLNKQSFVRKGTMEPLAGQVRSYAYVPNQQDGLDYDEWIEASVAGRSFISAGPVMFFTVNGEMPGSTLSLKSAGGGTTVSAEIDARWIGGLERIDFIVNGQTVSERMVDGTEAIENINIEIDKSSWIACHVQGRRFDEFEGIAHSGAVYIELDDRPIRSTEDAQYFVEWIDKHIALLDSADHFEFDWQEERTVDLYRDAQDVFKNLASGGTTAIAENNPLPLSIDSASPNPFNAHTTLSYTLPEAGMTEIEIYNAVGQKVRSLLSETMQAGTYRIVWNGRDDDGNEVSTGLYICRLKCNALYKHSKLMLIR